MSKPATSNYITEAAKLETEPRYFVRFYWINSSGTTYKFSRDFATGAITSSTNDPLQILDTIQGNTQTVEPGAGRSSIGQIRLTFIDGDGAMLRYVSNPKVTLKTSRTSGSASDIEANADISGYPPKGTIDIEAERFRYTSIDTATDKFQGITPSVDGTTAAAHAVGVLLNNGEEVRPKIRAQLFAGYEGIAEADYMSVAWMEVINRRMLADMVSWEITVADIQRFFKKRLFLKATKDAQITRPGNPVTLALETLLTSGTLGGNHATYDTGKADEGLDIPLNLIDVTGLELLRDTHFKNETFSFVISGPEDGKVFLERDFWLAMNCVPFITADGKYSAKRLNAPIAAALGTGEFGALELGEESGTIGGFPATNDAALGGGELGQGELGQEATIALTESDILGWEWRFGDDEIVNRVAFAYDHNLDENPGTFNTRQTYKAIRSKQTFGERAPIVIETKGVKTLNDGQVIADERALFFLKRFSEPPPVLVIPTHYRNNRIEVLDTITLTHSDIPNPATGSRGITAKLFEVIDMTPTFGLTGGMRLTLLSVDDFLIYSTQPSDGADTTSSLVEDTTPPAVPTGLAVTTSSRRHSTTGAVTAWIEATWTANTEADLSHYIVELDRDSDSKIEIRTPVSAKILFESLPVGESYTARIAAVDVSGNASAFSSTVPVTTGQDTTPPAVPTGLACTQAQVSNPDGTFSFNLKATWDANTEADFEAYRIRLLLPDGTKHSTTTSDETAQTWEGLQQGGSYKVKIKAKDKNGNKSAFSSEVTCAVGTDTTAPSIPSGLTVVPAFKTLFLDWNANTTDNDFSHIEVWRHTADVQGSATKIAEVKTTFYSDTSLGHGVTRYYWLKSVDTSGNASGFTASAGVSGTTVQVVTADMAALSVDNSILAALAVDAAKLENSAVTSTKIANLAVGRAAIAALAVGNAQLGNAAITSAKIEDLAVDAAKIANATITDAQISSLSATKITAGILQNGAGTLKFDLDASLLTVNLAGGLKIDAADGMKVTGDAGILFNAAGSESHRISPITTSRALEIAPVGITSPIFRIGTSASEYAQVDIHLKAGGNGFRVIADDGSVIFAVEDDGVNVEKVGFYGNSPVARPANWTITNDLTVRSFNANGTSIAQLADVVATLITDLAAGGIIGDST